MKDVVEALYDFFSGFGLPAYAENDVPTEAAPPYITVQLIEPSWDATAPFYARVWYRGASYAPILTKVDEIESAIGTGISLPMADGAVWIHKGANFAQRMPMEGDPALKCVYLNLNIQVNKG